MKLVLFIIILVTIVEYSSSTNPVQKNLTDEEALDNVYYFVSQLERTNTEDNYPYDTSENGFKIMMTGFRFMIEDQSYERLGYMFGIQHTLYENKQVKKEIDNIWNDHQKIKKYFHIICNSVIDEKEYYKAVVDYQGLPFPEFDYDYIFNIVYNECVDEIY